MNAINVQCPTCGTGRFVGCKKKEDGSMRQHFHDARRAAAGRLRCPKPHIFKNRVGEWCCRTLRRHSLGTSAGTVCVIGGSATDAYAFWLSKRSVSVRDRILAAQPRAGAIYTAWLADRRARLEFA